MKPEDALHNACASYLDLALPKDSIWSTFPAGGGGRVRGAKLKRQGLRKGWPDIQVLYRGRAIFLELKAPKGRLSPEQKQVHTEIVLAGGVVTTCKTLLEVQEFLKVLGMPLRATI